MVHGTILVVDDNLDNRRLLRLMLEKAGFAVQTAESGAEALSLYQKHPIDVVLLDLQMPEMDGITTLKNLRQIDGNAQVIVITAYGSIESVGWKVFVEQPVSEVFATLNASILRTAALLVAGLVISALVALALARGIAPLNELQQRIRRRRSEDLSPIDEREAPEEVAPLVGAINDLLARLDRSIGAQKSFLADAAHQLKTPLAGLRTQAELAQREIDAGQRDARSLKRSLQQIAHSSQRAAHMVNQLLAMARAEDKESAIRLQEVRLSRLAREVVRDFVPHAMTKRIDLGYEGPDGDDNATRMLGQPLLIRELIRNLVDNALRYTPSGGMVTVRVTSDPFGQVVVLQVEDSGPGIAEAERELVFRPFYRTIDTEADGSGLGLAIVKEIATRHDTTVTVGEARTRTAAAGQGPGALFTLRFARTAAAPPG